MSTRPSRGGRKGRKNRRNDHRIAPASSTDPRDAMADHLVVRAIEELIKKGTVCVYLNSAGRVFVHTTEPGLVELNDPCPGHGCENWISQFAWQRFGVVLRQCQLARISRLLAGRAPSPMPTAVSDGDALAVIESNPTVAAVIEFMGTHERHENGMAAFWTALSQFARDKGILRIGRNRLPAGPSALSRRLSADRAVLARCGIDVDIRRSNGSRVVLTKRTDADAPAQMPSTVPSAPNAEPTAELCAPRTQLSQAESLRNRIRLKRDGDCSQVQKPEGE